MTERDWVILILIIISFGEFLYIQRLKNVVKYAIETLEKYRLALLRDGDKDET